MSHLVQITEPYEVNLIDWDNPLAEVATASFSGSMVKRGFILIWARVKYLSIYNITVHSWQFFNFIFCKWKGQDVWKTKQDSPSWIFCIGFCTDNLLCFFSTVIFQWFQQHKLNWIQLRCIPNVAYGQNGKCSFSSLDDKSKCFALHFLTITNSYSASMCSTFSDTLTHSWHSRQGILSHSPVTALPTTVTCHRNVGKLAFFFFLNWCWWTDLFYTLQWQAENWLSRCSHALVMGGSHHFTFWLKMETLHWSKADCCRCTWCMCYVTSVCSMYCTTLKKAVANIQCKKSQFALTLLYSRIHTSVWYPHNTFIKVEFITGLTYSVVRFLFFCPTCWSSLFCLKKSWLKWHTTILRLEFDPFVWLCKLWKRVCWPCVLITLNKLTMHLLHGAKGSFLLFRNQ